MGSCPYSRGRRPASSAQNSSSSILPKVSRPSVHRNPNFRDITRSVEQNEILNETFRVVSRFPRYISCISRKIDYLWDSAGWRKRGSGIKPETSVRRNNYVPTELSQQICFGLQFVSALPRISVNISLQQRQRDNIKKISDNVTIF